MLSSKFEQFVHIFAISRWTIHVLLMTEDNTYWFSRSGVQGHMLHVVKPCKHDADWTVSARTVILDTHTIMTIGMIGGHIDFQGQGSKVKVTRYTLLLNLVNSLYPLSYDHQTWYTYFLWQEDDTYWFSRSGVKGWGHLLNIVVNDVVWWGFDRKCHRYLLVLLWMFHFFWQTDWKCIKCDVLGK